MSATRKTPLLAVLLAALAAACGDKPKKVVVEEAPAREPFTCFDLRGAVRTALMASPDGKTLHFAERAFERGVLRYDLVALDRASKKTTVIATDVGTQAAAAGDGKFVFLRPIAEPETTVGYPERRPEPPAARLYSLAAGGGPVPLSPEGMHVTSFAVDPGEGAVYYTVVVPGGWGFELRKVPVAGGESTRLGSASLVYGVADGGAALIVRARGADDMEIQKIPAAGGAPLWTAPDGTNVQVTDSAVLYLQGNVAPRPLVALALADGKAVTPEGTAPEDIPLTSGVPGFVQRASKGAWTALRLRDGKLSPLASYQGAALHALAPLPDGSVAAAVTHDTDGDARVSTSTIDDHDDESDICVLWPADSQPLGLPFRAAPKDLLAASRVLSTLTREPDLATARLRFIRSGTLLVVDVPGAGPAEPELLRRRVKEIQKKVTELSKRPQLGVSLRFSETRRHGTSLWSDPLGRFVTKVGVTDMVMDDKETAEIEIEPVRPAPLKFKTASDPRKLAIAPTCAGKVKNLTGAPLQIEVECAAYSPYVFTATPWTTARGPTKPATLEPGATGTYEVKLPFLEDDDARLSTRFSAGGKALEAADAPEYAHVADWLSTLDRIQQKTGILPRVKEPTFVPTLQYDAHRWPAFDEPEDFGTLGKKAQEAIAAVLIGEVEGHFTRHDGRLAPNAVLYGDEDWTWKIEGGKLKKRGE